MIKQCHNLFLRLQLKHKQPKSSTLAAYLVDFRQVLLPVIANAVVAQHETLLPTFLASATAFTCSWNKTLSPSDQLKAIKQ